MTVSRLLRKLFLLLFAGFASAAHACTVCDSLTAHRVRAGIFNGHFLHTSSLVAAPFPIFAIAIGLLHFGMPDLHLAADLPKATQAGDSKPLESCGAFAQAESAA